MGLASIKVVLTLGEFSQESHLYDFANTLYGKKQIQYKDDERTDFKSLIYKTSIFTCGPCAGVEAFFQSAGVKEFEVLILTGSRGNMFEATETVVRAIYHELKRTEKKASITVRIKDYEDDQTYIIGRIVTQWAFIWQALFPQISATIVALLLIPISWKWLDSYFQESIAAFITALIMFTMALHKTWGEAKGITNIHWRTTKENGG